MSAVFATHFPYEKYQPMSKDIKQGCNKKVMISLGLHFAFHACH